MELRYGVASKSKTSKQDKTQERCEARKRRARIKPFRKQARKRSKQTIADAIKKATFPNKRKKERREGRMKDALALGGEEGRDKLRKAAERGKYP